MIVSRIFTNKVYSVGHTPNSKYRVIGEDTSAQNGDECVVSFEVVTEGVQLPVVGGKVCGRRRSGCVKYIRRTLHKDLKG